MSKWWNPPPRQNGERSEEEVVAVMILLCLGLAIVVAGTVTASVLAVARRLLRR